MSGLLKNLTTHQMRWARLIYIWRTSFGSRTKCQMWKMLDLVSLWWGIPSSENQKCLPKAHTLWSLQSLPMTIRTKVVMMMTTKKWEEVPGVPIAVREALPLASSFGHLGIGEPAQYLDRWPEHPCAISFFRVHTILHDILGFDTIITRYCTIFLIW